MTRKMIFHLTQRGLCSEIITLIYCIAYARSHNLEIVVNDRFWNSNYTNGWEDYFEKNSLFQLEREAGLIFKDKYPHNILTNFKGFIQYIYIIYSIKVSNKLVFNNSRIKYLKPLLRYGRDMFSEDKATIELLGNELINYDVHSSIYWKKIFEFCSKEKIIEVNNQEILTSKLLSSIANEIWKLRSELKESRYFTKNYVSLHIRRGDKLKKEAKIVQVENFIQFLEQKGLHLKPILIASDDFSVIQEFRGKRPNWQISSLVKENLKGHSQSHFNNQSKEDIYLDTQKFLKEIDIHIEASVFVGSISSNVTKLISLIRNDKYSTFSLDTTEVEVYSKFHQFYT